MAKKRPPAFQMYADDFLVGTLDMTPEETGVYIKLLCYQWTKGSIPLDLGRIASALAGSNKAILEQVLESKFTKQADGWRNERLEQVRQDQQEYAERCERRAQAGKKAADARWGKNANAHASAYADGDANAYADAIPSPPPTPTPSRIEFEIDHGDFSNCERRYAAICKAMSPRNNGDRILAWQASVLSVVAYSENWLFDAVTATETARNVKNRFAYLQRCLREGARKLDRNFDEDRKRCPPLAKCA